jgi:hypothetical protein
MQAVHVILRDSLNIPLRSAPMTLADNTLWELGTAFLDRRGAATPVWFARRLATPEGRSQLQAAMTARPHPETIVVLSSARAERLKDITVPGVVTVAWRDVLSSPDSLAVDRALLGGRLRGVPDPLPAGPLSLSPDGKTLMICGRRFEFKSRPQIAAIGKLVAAYQAGVRVQVRDLTDHESPRRLFGEDRWAVLSPFIKSRRDGWWGFDI